MQKSRLLSAFLLLAAAVLFLPAPTRADDAPAILAKHFAYVGWQIEHTPYRSLIEAMKIVSKKGKLRYAGEVRRLGLAYRLDLRSAKYGVESSSGFTGNIAWQSDANGFTTPMIGASGRLLIDRDIIFNEAYATLPAAQRPSTTIGGHTYPVVRISPNHLPPFDLAFDSKTGALVQATIDPESHESETMKIDAYSDALPGKRLISAYHYAGSSARYELSEFRPNVPVTPVQVEPPTQTATWNFANPKPFPVKVTQYRILVDASINGVKGRFILDSGAAGIFLSRSFAKKAKLETIGHGEAMGVSGSTRITVMRANTLEIGGNTLSNVIASSGRGSGLGADGLIGFPVLADTIATVDFANSTLRLQDPSTVTPHTIPGVHTVIDLADETPQVPMKIDGRIDVNAFLDTGDPYQVLIPRSMVLDDNLTMLVDNTLTGYFASHLVVGGVGGGYQIGDCGHVDSIALGRIIYQNPTTCETTSFIGYRALVGLDFLRHFKRIIFDYPQSRMIFVPKV
ncbi:MAG: retropepsin-like aspartic protease [Candidatus Baltobacteraceae bacterium]